MSETPKPPEGYATWLDYVLDPGDPYKSFAGEWAAAELAALRAERDELKRKLSDVADTVLRLRDERYRLRTALKQIVDKKHKDRSCSLEAQGYTEI